MNHVNEPGLKDIWTPIWEYKKFHRLYFTPDSLFVIKAPNDRLKFYISVEIVAIFLLAGGILNLDVVIPDYLFGVVLTVICGTITGGLALIVAITLMLWSIDKKIKQVSQNEVLKLDKGNYSITYSDISNIELKILTKSFFKKKGELMIVSSQGTHKLIISEDYFNEIKNNIENIKRHMSKEAKGPKKIKLKSTDRGGIVQ